MKYGFVRVYRSPGNVDFINTAHLKRIEVFHSGGAVGARVGLIHPDGSAERFKDQDAFDIITQLYKIEDEKA